MPYSLHFNRYISAAATTLLITVVDCPAADISGSANGLAPGHVTNYAQNENGDVWDLQQFSDYLGAGKWRQLWSAMSKVTAMTFAAVLRRIQEVQVQMDLPPRWVGMGVWGGGYAAGSYAHHGVHVPSSMFLVDLSQALSSNLERRFVQAVRWSVQHSAACARCLSCLIPLAVGCICPARWLHITVQIM